TPSKNVTKKIIVFFTMEDVCFCFNNSVNHFYCAFLLLPINIYIRVTCSCVYDLCLGEGNFNLSQASGLKHFLIYILDKSGPYISLQVRYKNQPQTTKTPFFCCLRTRIFLLDPSYIILLYPSPTLITCKITDLFPF